MFSKEIKSFVETTPLNRDEEDLYFLLYNRWRHEYNFYDM